MSSDLYVSTELRHNSIVISQGHGAFLPPCLCYDLSKKAFDPGGIVKD